MLRFIKNTWFNTKLHLATKDRNLCLLYHHVDDKQPLSNIHSVSLNAFKKQIIALKKHWKFVNEDEFFDKKELSTHKILLTFDDNYQSTLSIVAPFLETENIPYVFFVNSSTIEGNLLWRDKIKLLIEKDLTKDFIEQYNIQLSEIDFLKETKNPEKTNSKIISNQLEDFFQKQNILYQYYPYNTSNDLRKFAQYRMIKFGNHSHNHFCLSTLTTEEIDIEIKTNHYFLQQNFPKEKISRLFSIPFGSFASYNQTTIDVLNKYGYLGALMSAPHYYFHGKSNLSLEKYDFVGYKRLLPKEYYRFYYL